jgi:hypothetical protein
MTQCFVLLNAVNAVPGCECHTQALKNHDRKSEMNYRRKQSCLKEPAQPRRDIQRHLPDDPSAHDLLTLNHGTFPGLWL